jgi:uncharacterized protein (TIGR02391 family)
MIQQYVHINRVLRKIVYFAWDALQPTIEDETFAYISSYLEREIRELDRLWPKGVSRALLSDLKEKAKYSDAQRIRKIIDDIVPDIENKIDDHFSSMPSTDITFAITDFLHPAIIASSYAQYKTGHYREAVLNAVIKVFDLIRDKTKIDKDGSDLVCEALSISRPKLIISTLDTESGQNEQKGYLEILRGAYLGIRNPKAHSLLTDLTEVKTAQYLIFASLLARRIDEARVA